MTQTTFKTFPQFSKLTFADRERYEALIQDFPPLSDLAFVSLMTLWNALDTVRVAVLNGNLVISYWLPGDDKRSGLSLVGTNRVDESLCVIFDHLKNSEQDAKLVNVPLSVVDHIRYPEIFDFEFKSSNEDYIVSLRKYALLDVPFYRRTRIKTFVRNSGNLEVKSLDLRSASNREMLLESAARWPRKGLNNVGKFENDALHLCIPHAPEMAVKSVCLFDDGELIAYNLYYVFPDRRYILIAHSRSDYSIPGIFDYMCYAFSKWWLSQGIEFANIHADMGVAKLRIFKVMLRPVELFRKCTIRPAERIHV